MALKKSEKLLEQCDCIRVVGKCTRFYYSFVQGKRTIVERWKVREGDCDKPGI